MRAEFWAVATALCWALGSLLEKRGLKLGQMSPVLGAGIRTVFSLLLLSVLSCRYWGELRTCGTKSILLIALGGGVLAGGLGIASLYMGLKSGNIAIVMTVAFCLTPIVAATAGHFVLKERLSSVQMLGICLCITGAALTLYFRSE